MSIAIKKLYTKAGLTPPDGKGIHTMKFHRCVVECAKKQGGRIEGKVNCHAVCMGSIGKKGAVKKGHQRNTTPKRSTAKRRVARRKGSRMRSLIRKKIKEI